MTLFICALGAFFLTQIIREFSPYEHKAPFILFVVLVTAGFMAWLMFPHETRTWVFVTFGAAGLAVLLHQLGRLLRLLGDRSVRDLGPALRRFGR